MLIPSSRLSFLVIRCSLALVTAAACAAHAKDGPTSPGWLRSGNWAALLPKPGAQAATDTTPPAGSALYVDSAEGNDNAPGTMAKPLKTLARATTALSTSGNALLLKCGSVWREALAINPSGSAPPRLFIGAYGDCSRRPYPVITASNELDAAGWRPAPASQPGAYLHRYAGDASQLFVNGKRLVVARYPNYQGVGHEFGIGDGINKSRSMFQLRQKDLSAVGRSDLVGATIYLRSVPWKVEKATIRSFDAGTGRITLDRDLVNPIMPNTGYILEGKQWMLDAPGEWLLDKTERNIYIFAADKGVLQQPIEVTTRDRVIAVNNASNLTIERISVSNAGVAGIELTQTKGVTLSQVKVSNAAEHGIRASNSPGLTIKDSTVENSGSMGISARTSDQVDINRNLIKDTGLDGYPGGTDAGIAAEGMGARITNNLVLRSANLGIRFFNKPGTQVSGNSVVQPCLRMIDCAGIYTWTSTDPKGNPGEYKPLSTVKGNMIVGSRGNMHGSGNRGEHQAAGIYLDEMTSGANVSDNIVVASSVGIYLHNAQFNMISGNQILGPAYASFSGNLTRHDRGMLKGNVVTKNTFTLWEDASPDIYSFQWLNQTDPNDLFEGKNPNRVSANTVNALSGRTMWSMNGQSIKQRMFAQDWRRYAPDDTEITKSLVASVSRATSGPSLLANTMDSKQWMPYFNPAGSGGTLSTTTAPAACSKGCLKFSAGHPNDLLSSRNFQLDTTPGNNSYRLKYTAIGGKGGGLSRAVIRRAGPPYESFGLDQTATMLKEGEELNNEVVFEASGSRPARLDLIGRVGGETLFKDVSLQRVAPKGAEAPAVSVVVNLKDKASPVACNETGLKTCNAMDMAGKRVVWPLDLPARSVKLLILQ